MQAGPFYTIKSSDVGRSTIRFLGRTWLVTSWIGRILPRDIGKRVYVRHGILQVESDEQLYARTKRRNNPMPREITIHVEGGTVTTVDGLREGETVRIIDRDAEESDLWRVEDGELALVRRSRLRR